MVSFALIWSIIEFFTELYTETDSDRPKLDGMELKSISEQQKSWMERDFRETQVKGAIETLDSEKSPGPEGFPMEVYKKMLELHET